MGRKKTANNADISSSCHLIADFLPGCGRSTSTADKWLLVTGAFVLGISKRKERLKSGLTLMGGASVRFPRRLELAEVSLTSDATLAESESRSSLDPPALLQG